MTKPALEFGTTVKRNKGKRPSHQLLSGDQRTVVSRRVKAIANILREALRQNGNVLTAALDLEVLTLARITCRMEIVVAEATKGFDTDDEVLTRLANAQARGLKRLGLRPALLEVPKRPGKPLIETLRQFGKAPPASP